MVVDLDAEYTASVVMMIGPRCNAVMQVTGTCLCVYSLWSSLSDGQVTNCRFCVRFSVGYMHGVKQLFCRIFNVYNSGNRITVM